MKKLAIILLLIFASCSEQETAIEIETANEAQLNYYDKGYIETAPLSEQLEYKRYHMKKMASWLSKNNEAVYNYFSGEVNRNPESDSFYVSDIINAVNEQNNEREQLSEDLLFTLNAFENLDGSSVYPNVVIHDMTKYNNREPYDGSKPLFAMTDYDIENQEQIARGYQENSTGVLVEINEPMVEGLIDEENLIILTMSPCGGEVNNDPNNQRAPCGSGGGGGGGSQFGVVHRITSLIVKDHKEPFPLRSDVTLIGFKTLGLPFENGDCGARIFGSSNCINEPEGRFIKEFKRSWVSNETEIEVNKLIDAYDNDFNVDIYFALIIFERDNWPISVNTIEFPFPNGVVRTMGYRSDGSEYHHVLLKNKLNTEGLDSMDDYAFSNDSIEGLFL